MSTPALLVVVSFGTLALSVGVLALRLADQRRRDADRARHEIHFPSDLKAEQVEAAILARQQQSAPDIAIGRSRRSS